MIENKITIDEIAKRANVSIATVSRIINNKDNVKSDKTKSSCNYGRIEFFSKDTCLSFRCQ